MASKQTKVIAVLAGILLAAVASSIVIIWLVPDVVVGPSTSLPASDEPVSTSAPVSGGATFNVSVLGQSEYLLLDKQPVVEGAIPVRPPATTGKANPFL